MNGSIASITALCCFLPLRRQPEFNETFKSLSNKSSGNVVRTDVHAHPQHIKFVTFHICTWYWCVSPHEWVFHCTMLWFALQEVTGFQSNFLNVCWQKQHWCWSCKDRFICTSTACEVVKHIMFLILMWEPSWVGTVSITTLCCDLFFQRLPEFKMP